MLNSSRRVKSVLNISPFNIFKSFRLLIFFYFLSSSAFLSELDDSIFSPKLHSNTEWSNCKQGTSLYFLEESPSSFKRFPSLAFFIYSFIFYSFWSFMISCFAKQLFWIATYWWQLLKNLRSLSVCCWSSVGLSYFLRGWDWSVFSLCLFVGDLLGVWIAEKGKDFPRYFSLLLLNRGYNILLWQGFRCSLADFDLILHAEVFLNYGNNIN